MTNEEALQEIHEMFCFLLMAKQDEMSNRWKKAFVKAHDALHKQIQKSPTGDLHSVPHYRCPSCKGGVVVYEGDPHTPFCQWCGQALKWGDQE